MPVINQYEPSIAPSSLPAGRGASPLDAGANVGASMEATGNEITTAAYRVNEDQGRLWAYNAASAMRISAQKDLQQRQQQANPADANFATFADDYTKEFQDHADTLIASAPSRSAQKYLGMHLATLKDNLYQHAAGFQAQLSGEYSSQMHQEGTDKNTQSLTINPGNDNFNQIRSMSESEIDGLAGLNAVQKLKLKADDLRKFSFAQVTGAALSNSAGFLRDVGLTGQVNTPKGPVSGVGTGVAAASSDPFFERALTSMGLSGPVASFARAIYQQESGGGKANTSGVNSSNVTGPMQVQQETFEGLKSQGLLPKNANWMDPQDNKLAGAALIRQLRDNYGGDPAKMAAAYYSGPKAVNADGSINRDYRDLKNPNAPTVGQYVDSVVGRISPTGASPVQPADAEPAPEGTIISAQSSLDGWDHLTVQQRIQTVRMAEQNIRAQNAGLGAQAAAAARALKAGQEQFMNGLFDKITDPKGGADITTELRGDNPKNTLTFEQREKVVNFQKAFNAGQDKTDPSTFNNLFEQIHTGKITDPEQLTPFLGNGIAYNDLAKLRGEIEGKGQPLAQQKAAFFASAKSQISSSTLMSHDPDGEKAYYNFVSDANGLIDAKMKAGVPLGELLNPKSKDFVGSIIPNYQRSTTQQVKDMTARLGNGGASILPPEQLRKAGETPAQYVARIQGAR